MKKEKTSTRQKLSVTAMTMTLIAVILSGIAGYSLAYSKYHPRDAPPTQNTPGYITTEEARNQVNGFYEQYLHPKNGSPDELRKAYIDSYGTRNLMFYSEYYQHGFDPIVCSATMPTSVTAKKVQPGPGALVGAEATYPDGATATIDLTLVLNYKGFGIDTITCPGDKGNLPPKESH